MNSYVLVNYEDNWKYEKLFKTFKDAYMMHQIFYKDTNNIECIDWKNNKIYKVWDEREYNEEPKFTED